MNLTTMLKAADLCYQYSDEDKQIIRHMAMTDKAGLTAALEADPLLPWIAFEHGFIDEPPKWKGVADHDDRWADYRSNG